MYASRIQNLNSQKWIVISGLVLVFLIHIIVFNSNLLVPIHDQFDGEILTYILKARNPFSNTIDQLFNGTSSISMTPPAILFTLSYVVFTPSTAFWVNYLFIVLIAYLGMYLCVSKLVEKGWIAIITSVLFTFLPFYSVYGLSVMGQPLLIFSFCILWEIDQNITNAISKRIFPPLFFIAFFAFSSSLVLVGFADIILLVSVVLYGLYKGRRVKFFTIGLLVLCLLYAIIDWRLITSILGLSGFITHKSEYVVSSNIGPVLWSIRKFFEAGQYHAASNHKVIAETAGLSILFAGVFWKRLEQEDKVRIIQMGLLYLFALLIAVFYALWHCEAVSILRNRIGGFFVTFQVDRLYWLYPVIWFVLFAYQLYFLHKLIKTSKFIRIITITLVVMLNTVFLWNNSVLKTNWNANRAGIIPSGYSTIDGFFQEDMFNKIDNMIHERSGKQKKEYRVISVGLYPSIALYNGFYCLDGYSNNYDVRYKHEFREIIAKELDNNQSLKKYFDTWGNRVYAFSSEIPRVYYPRKGSGIKIKNLRFDFSKLRAMDCEYVFSAVPIQNCKELELIGHFKTDSSYYEVFVYELTRHTYGF